MVMSNHEEKGNTKGEYKERMEENLPQCGVILTHILYGNVHCSEGAWNLTRYEMHDEDHSTAKA